MPSLYRLATGTLLEATPRKVASASFSRSTILSSAALPVEPFMSPILDIFDAPVMLRERNTHSERLKTHSPISYAHATPRVNRSPPKGLYSDVLGSPWSLGPPIVFDGPACPPHMSPSALQERRLQRQSFSRPLSGDHGFPTLSCGTFSSQSEPIYQLFDGPSRVPRRKYMTAPNERNSLTYASLVLCLSSAFGWLVIKDDLDPFQDDSVRSP